MEDILDVYEMPYDPWRSVICMDEKPYQLLGETKEALSMRPGDTQKTDSEYIRKRACSIFVFTELLAGWRHVTAQKQCQTTDWAEKIHYTLVYGSWLNIAEIELNAMTCQCLAHRIDILENLNRELGAWE